MKKKLLILFMILIVATGLSQVLLQNTAQAEEQIMINQLKITQMPSKTTYTAGEELDLSDMVVEGYGYDGSRYAITDYTVAGYDSNKVGLQAVMIQYNNQTTAFLVTVLPGRVSAITVKEYTDSSITLTWDAMDGIIRYEIYSLDSVTGEYILAISTDSNTISLPYSSTAIQSYQILAVTSISGMEYRGAFSDPFMAVIGPGMVTGLTALQTTTSSVSLAWDAVTDATGYIIYRSPSSEENYTVVGQTDSVTYTDNNLSSGQGYLYKIRAYILDESHAGGFSQVIDISTNPAKTVLKYKAGDGKVRITWTKVNGATSYELYGGNDVEGIILLASIQSDSTLSYLAEGLSNDTTYSFYAVAKREYNGNVYDSPASELILVTPVQALATSITAKYFPAEEEFMNSMAYKTFSFFRTNVDYSKSFIIPGLINTNVNGFTSTTMVPQGLTVAGDYLIMSAYDLKAEEDTVLYVMDKNTKELLTTLILPSKPHAGGLAFDGTNLWITTGAKISSILFTQVVEAVEMKAPYSYIQYSYTHKLGITASYIGYYDGKLWVGSYNELKTTYMYSFLVDNTGTLPVLSKTEKILMPNRVQGIAFTLDGTLIISRSCQLYKGLRGYFRQLDVYNPVYAGAVNGVIKLGKRINYIQMPSMNEGIVVDGDYLYVAFESAAFANASYKMDRICAFPVANVINKPVE